MGGTASQIGFLVVGRLDKKVGNVGSGETVLNVGKGGNDEGKVGNVGNVGNAVVGRIGVGVNVGGMGAKVVVIVGITVVVTVGIVEVVIVGANVKLTVVVVVAIVVVGKVSPGDTVMYGNGVVR